MIRARPKEDLLAMYDEIDEVNKILCLPTKDRTEAQKELIRAHVGGANGLTYPTEEQLTQGCEHVWKEYALLTSTVTECIKCGEKK
jgi:hypothetical protein